MCSHQMVFGRLLPIGLRRGFGGDSGLQLLQEIAGGAEAFGVEERRALGVEPRRGLGYASVGPHSPPSPARAGCGISGPALSTPNPRISTHAIRRRACSQSAGTGLCDLSLLGAGGGYRKKGKTDNENPGGPSAFRHFSGMMYQFERSRKTRNKTIFFYNLSRGSSLG